MAAKINNGKKIAVVGDEQAEPLFDWREQLDDADYIILELQTPRPTAIGARRRKPSPGLDLIKHRESLARFLADLGEGYVLACQDFETRSDPKKPHRILSQNWKDGDSPRYDYGADADEGFNFDWDEFWRQTYARDRGNPGGNRTTTKRKDPRPAIEPVRMNFLAIERWWTNATGKKFRPEFARPGNGNIEAEPFDRNNSAARFLILVIQSLHERFDPANARGLFDTVKKQRGAKKARSK